MRDESLRAWHDSWDPEIPEFKFPVFRPAVTRQQFDAILPPLDQHYIQQAAVCAHDGLYVSAAVNRAQAHYS